MELDGAVQNGVIVPQGECPLADGTKVRIHADTAPAADEPTIWDKLRDLGKKAELRETNLPTDLAENHDHYLHGAQADMKSTFADSFHFMAVLS